MVCSAVLGVGQIQEWQIRANLHVPNPCQIFTHDFMPAMPGQFIAIDYSNSAGEAAEASDAEAPDNLADS